MKTDYIICGLFGLLVLTYYGIGLYLAFSASVLIGIVGFLIPPLLVISGFVYLASGIDAAAELVKLLGV